MSTTKFRRPPNVPHIRMRGNLETPDATEVIVEAKDNAGNVLRARGLTVPGDNENGYAKGCIFMDTDVAAGTSGFYENIGDTSNCNFDIIGEAGAATTFVSLTDTPANFTAAANKILKVNTGGTAVEFVTVSGDVALAAGGGMTVTDLTFTSEARGTLVRRGATVWAIVQCKTAGQVVMGDGTDVISQAITGDVALTGGGVATVTDLTIASEAWGDILFRGTAGWVRLAADNAKFLRSNGAGSDVSWETPAVGAASSIADGCTLQDAGALDAVFGFTEQTVGAPTLTIPDFASVSDTFVFKTLAETLANKTLTSPVVQTQLTMEQTTNDAIIVATDQANQDNTYTIPDVDGNDSFCMLTAAQTLTNKTLTLPIIATGGKIVDANGAEWIEFLEDATPVDHLLITQGDADVGLTLTATSSGANSGGLLLDAKGTGDVVVLNGTELTFRRATFDALVVVADQTGEDHTFNIPDLATGASDTFCFIAEAQTLTNKSVDADTNTITNIEGSELKVAADGGHGVTFVIRKTFANPGAAGVNIYVDNAPFDFRVLDAWSVAKSADGGTWALHKGKVGALGNAITNTVTVAGVDKDVDRPTTMDDAEHEIATGGSLCLVADGGGALDIELYVLCERV